VPEDGRDLLDAVIHERMMEKASRAGREFADRDFWSAYVAAVVARRAAVDDYLRHHPEEQSDPVPQPSFAL